MPSSTVVEARDNHWFDQHVFHKFLELGFRVFGGAIRNRIWRTINESDRKQRFGDNYHTNMWDSNFDNESWYNRRGNFTDIDCIGTYEQYKLLTCPEMVKFGDLKFKVSTKKIAYPIPGIKVVEDELETFTVKVSSKIRSHIYRVVDVDMFVCKSDKLEQLYELLGRNLDFACNSLCMQKIDGVLTTSVMHRSSFERQYAIIDEMKRDEATLVNPVTKTIYHRVAKMLAYGWFVEFDTFTLQNEYQEENEHTLFLFARSSDSVRCIMCDHAHHNYGSTLYVRVVNDIYYHLSCYVEKSIQCYEAVTGTRFTRQVSEHQFVRIGDPDINDAESEQSDSETSPELILVEPSDTTPVSNELTENNIRTADDEDDTASLDRFTQFARRQTQMLDDVVSEENDNIQIVGNVVFFDGIAQTLNEQELADLRHQIGGTDVDVEVLDAEAARQSINYFRLCSSFRHVDTLTQLKEFMEYFEQRYYIVLRP